MKIAIVCGSQSFEHEISIVSAIAMKDVLQCEIEYIFIDKDREFYHIPSNDIKSKLFSSGEYKKYDKLFIQHGGFYKKGIFGSKNFDIDVVLNLVHGGDGEDGILASLFKFYDIKFIGPRVEASALSCNKYLTKLYADGIEVKTIDYALITNETRDSIKTHMPFIIKPLRLGSSIGVSIVKQQSELEYALDVAFEFDSEVLIEPFISDIKEYNLAGTKVDSEFIFSIVEEPQKTGFLDFDKKYLDFNRTSKASAADISDELKEKLKDSFKSIYGYMFEGSIIRCDFFVVENEVYLNEINPIPGSMANYLFDDFNSIFKSLANNLPKERKVPINYEYVNKIQVAKGK
jgi:D-alanine-D-alanine ligase